jgi:UDP-N-acetylglucosamine--N-acetylmuramyl-(pentapeptide) pyrophosphoryl-undecaprenol N-acetylglucosamine transferase
VKDEQLPERLAPTVRDLLNDEAQRAAMAEAARSLARPDAAQQLANLLLSLGKVV